MGACTSKSPPPRPISSPNKNSTSKRGDAQSSNDELNNSSTQYRGGSTNDGEKLHQTFDKAGGKQQSQSEYSPHPNTVDLLQTQRSSKLEESQRRRLSVSTVSTDGIVVPPLSPNNKYASPSALKNVSKQNGNDAPSPRVTPQAYTPNSSSSSSSPSPGSTSPDRRRQTTSSSAGVGGGRNISSSSSATNSASSSKSHISSSSSSSSVGHKTSIIRTAIRKYQDPALELVDEANGGIKDVSTKMILDLFNKSKHTFLMFGMPSYDVQRGFDNKVTEVSGTLANTLELNSIGVGYACKKGLKPESPNQDDFFIIKVDDWSMYGVFDGHGPCGHDVSTAVHRMLPFVLASDPQFETDLPLVLKRAFRKVHHLIEAASEQQDSQIDCTLSGTTGTVVIHRDNKLYVAHVGDSRCVLSTKVETGRFVSSNLTQDHKPTREEEKRRIEAAGGEVRRLEGDIPHRVFVKNRMYPGLAMSRAIGDTVGAAVGVVPDPDVRVYDLKSGDQFVIISTDGVWEFISSQESVDFVCRKKREEVQAAAEFLSYESWRRWVEEEENVVDDVTCIIAWVNNSDAVSDLGGPTKLS